MSKPKRLIRCVACVCEECYDCRRYAIEDVEPWHLYTYIPDPEKNSPYRASSTYSPPPPPSPPSPMSAGQRRYKARKLNATIGVIDEAAIYERDKVCIYYGLRGAENCTYDEDLTLDHLVPLARGGAHAQDNLAVACRSCNSSKHTKTYEEFVNEPRHTTVAPRA